MAEPLSIVAGVVGITVPALHGVRLLLDDLQQLKDAPKTVKRLADDVQSVDTALKLLQSVEDREWDLLGPSIAAESKMTISSCTQACDLFRPELQRWTRHSEDGKLAWRDRTSVGIFKQGQIKAMSEQLQNCKLTVNTIVSIATLYSSVRNSHITNDIKQAISANQAGVKSAITTTDKQLAVLEHRMDEMNLSSDDDDEEIAGSDGDKARVMQQLEQELQAVRVSRKLLDELLAKAQEDAVAEAAAKNKSNSNNATWTGANSGIQVHTLNGGVHGARFGRN